LHIPNLFEFEFLFKIWKNKTEIEKMRKRKKGGDYLGRGPLAARGAAPPPSAAWSGVQEHPRTRGFSGLLNFATWYFENSTVVVWGCPYSSEKKSSKFWTNFTK
jgi:hypothetical protein